MEPNVKVEKSKYTNSPKVEISLNIGVYEPQRGYLTVPDTKTVLFELIRGLLAYYQGEHNGTIQDFS